MGKFSTKDLLKHTPKLDISDEMPEYEDFDSNKVKDLIIMFKNILDSQQAGIDLMRRYIKIIERKIG